MKKAILLFTLLINFSFGQNSVKNEDFTDWEEPKNFEKFNLKKVRSYSIKINKKGKVKKDSLLLSEHNYDKMNNEIYGTFHYIIMASHDGGRYLEFYSFKNNYTQVGLLLQKVNTPIEKEKETKEEVEFNTNFELFEYDSLNRKVKETTYEESNTISLYKKDTTNYFKSIYSPKNTEYEYDSNNRIVKQFSSQDSTTYFIKSDNQKQFKISKDCGYCEPKYLNQEWIYEGYNLKKYISYTYQKAVHSKSYYYYNTNNQLIKQIDSTGYYYTNPHLKSITEFEYTDKYKKETQTNFDRDLYYKKETRKYNLENQLIYELLEAETSKYNIERNIEYSNNMKISTTINPHNLIHKEVFLYDKRGLLIEKKEFYNEIISQLTRYYYE